MKRIVAILLALVIGLPQLGLTATVQGDLDTNGYLDINKGGSNGATGCLDDNCTKDRRIRGLVIGTNVQAFDADLSTYAGITPSANVQSLLGAANYAAMKALMGYYTSGDAPTFASVTSSAADGSHFGTFYNTTTNPDCNATNTRMGGFASVGATPKPQVCVGTGWIDILTTATTLGSWTSGAGTVASGDTYLAALQKIDGNVGGKQATLTNSAGLAGALDDETGTGAAVFGTGPTIDGPFVTTAEVVKTADDNLTAAQVSGTEISNYGQTDNNETLVLPTAARGYSALFTVGTARAKTFGVKAKSTDKIYILNAAGTISAGSDNGKAVMVNAQVGQAFLCWTFKTDAYDWMCKAIAFGTSTFEAR